MIVYDIVITKMLPFLSEIPGLVSFGRQISDFIQAGKVPISCFNDCIAEVKLLFIPGAFLVVISSFQTEHQHV